MNICHSAIKDKKKGTSIYNLSQKKLHAVKLHAISYLSTGNYYQPSFWSITAPVFSCITSSGIGHSLQSMSPVK